MLMISSSGELEAEPVMPKQKAVSLIYPCTCDSRIDARSSKGNYIIVPSQPSCGLSEVACVGWLHVCDSALFPVSRLSCIIPGIYRATQRGVGVPACIIQMPHHY